MDFPSNPGRVCYLACKSGRRLAASAVPPAPPPLPPRSPALRINHAFQRGDAKTALILMKKKECFASKYSRAKVEAGVQLFNLAPMASAKPLQGLIRIVGTCFLMIKMVKRFLLVFFHVMRQIPKGNIKRERCIFCFLRYRSIRCVELNLKCTPSVEHWRETGGRGAGGGERKNMITQTASKLTIIQREQLLNLY